MHDWNSAYCNNRTPLNGDIPAMPVKEQTMCSGKRGMLGITLKNNRADESVCERTVVGLARDREEVPYYSTDITFDGSEDICFATGFPTSECMSQNEADCRVDYEA
ncbi:hypothetical protein C0J52_24481 [Blattella germanica]|nr:hypothetical protein C0J52_24481 [Blattella germanica]